MQISLQETTTVQRRLSVVVPADRVEQEVRSRLDSLARTVKIAGFRPGKVPMSEVQRRYGGKVRREVVDELVNSTFYEAVVKEKLRPAGAPKVESRRDTPGEDLEYTAVFEVYPEVKFKSLDGLNVDKPVAEISDQDVEDRLELRRHQLPAYEPVDRPARAGDQVVVDLGRDDGQPGEGHQMPVVIGAGTVVKGFEEALAGIKTGEEKTIELVFSADHHDPKVAGRPAQFHIKAVSVAEPRLPQVDDEFARRCGVEGGVEALRAALREELQREAESAGREVVKERLLQRLLEANPIDVPQTLIDDELRRATGTAPAAASDAAPFGEQLEERIRRRVAVALLIAELVRQQNLTVPPEALRAKVKEAAAGYGQPDKVVEWYYADRKRLQPFESMLLEYEAAKWLLDRARVREQPVTFQELVQGSREAPA